MLLRWWIPEHLSSPRFLMGFVLLILVFSAVLLCVFFFWVPCFDIRYDFYVKTMLGLSLPPVVCRKAHVLQTLFVAVCIKCCPTHIVLCSCFIFLRFVYHVLPVSLDCPFLIASVFPNVYSHTSVINDRWKPYSTR